MTTSSEHPTAGDEPRGDMASLRSLEDVLEVAVQLADASGLLLPAIRIEEALMLVRAQSGAAKRRIQQQPISSLN